MKSIMKRITSAIFAVCFCVLCMINIVSPKSEYSETENRYLAKFPEITLENLKNGDFMRAFEDYTSDQFILRDFFISVKARIERLLLRTENNGIYFAKDNYLIEKPGSYNIENVNSNLEALKALKELKRFNVSISLVPGAYEILKDKLPENAYKPIVPEITEYIKNELNDSGIVFCDPTSILNDNKDEYIYYRTDHHQTTYGSYLVYSVLGETLGYTPMAKDEFITENVSEEFLGTTWSKSMVGRKCADTVEVYVPRTPISYTVDFPYENKKMNTLYQPQNLEIKDKYTYFLDGNHGLEVIESSVKNGKQLMIVKDSYAHSIVPFLANHYEKIHMVDLRYFNTDIMEYLYKNGVSDILALYSLSGFITDTNLSKLYSWCETSPYAKQPYGLVYETDAVSDNYFSDAVFIGDSLTEGLRLYNSLKEKQFLSYVGMSLYGIESKKFPNENGEPVYSVMDMIASATANKFYIMLGTNDHISPDVMSYFISNYEKFIDNIKKYHPDATIYIQSILPVTPKKELEGRFKNEYIYLYNDALLELAKRKECYFIDVYKMCSDENGNLISNMSPDGIHLNIEYYRKWYDYLKVHAVGKDQSVDETVASIKPSAPRIAVCEEGVAIAEDLKTNLPFSDILWQIDNSIGIALYGVEGSWVKSAAVYAGSGATAEEIAVFEYKDLETAKYIQEKIQKHLSERKNSFENYLPSEIVKLTYPYLKVTDKYVIVCISDHNETAEKIISKYTKQQ